MLKHVILSGICLQRGHDRKRRFSEEHEMLLPIQRSQQFDGKLKVENSFSKKTSRYPHRPAPRFVKWSARPPEYVSDLKWK
jgi:hypothetical protein